MFIVKWLRFWSCLLPWETLTFDYLVKHGLKNLKLKWDQGKFQNQPEVTCLPQDRCNTEKTGFLAFSFLSCPVITGLCLWGHRGRLNVIWGLCSGEMIITKLKNLIWLWVFSSPPHSQCGGGKSDEHTRQKNGNSVGTDCESGRWAGRRRTKGEKLR